MVWPLKSGYFDEIKSLGHPVVIGQIDANDAASLQAFNSVAASFRGTVTFGLVSDSTKTDLFNKRHPSAIIYHPEDELEHIYDGAFEEASLSEMAASALDPLICQIDLEIYSHLRQVGVPFRTRRK